MFQSKLAYVGFGMITIFILVALFAPWLAPFNPSDIELGQSLSLPSATHWLGQDANGADILSRLIYGARISLQVGFWVVILSGFVGIMLGLISGYYGGVIDTILMRLVDVLLAFPGLLLAIALVAVLGPDIRNVIIALTALGWVPYARLVRAQVLTVKERDYVAAAKSSGQSDFRIMWIHIFPNIVSPIIVQSTFNLAGVIISESSLSFLGLGVAPGTPSWGAMLSAGKQVLIDAPHVSIFPGLAIMLLVLSFNFIGDALRDKWDPRKGAV